MRKLTYIGRARNLRRRLLHDHKNGNIRGNQFRKALMKNNRGLETENEITRYIKTNCEFRYGVIKDSDKRIRFEHFATALGVPELNVRGRSCKI
jgi:hypothetical protein